MCDRELSGCVIEKCACLCNGGEEEGGEKEGGEKEGGEEEGWKVEKCEGRSEEGRRLSVQFSRGQSDRAEGDEDRTT